jgi:hypothetical protein
MQSQILTLPELDRKLDNLPQRAVHQIARGDYERLFGFNDAALGRLRNFAKNHACVAGFAATAVLVRNKLGSSN